MSIFDSAYQVAKAKIQETKTWQAFDRTRRKTVRRALLAACTEASDLLGCNVAPDTSIVEKVVDKHLEAVAEAGLPIIELLKLFGVSSLLTLVKALDGGKDA